MAFLAAGTLSAAAPAAAQLPGAITTTTTMSAPAVPSTPTMVQTDLIEWDITPLGDIMPGSLAVDDRSSWKSKVWFVTRLGGPARLYRFLPGYNMKHDHATAKSWPLADAQLTGGVRLRHSEDGRYAFVNANNPSSGVLIAVDTRDDSVITWPDRPLFDQMSDVAVDVRDGGTQVVTAAPYYNATDFPGVNGVVQKLKVGAQQLHSGRMMVYADVTRYPLGGGAGTCNEFTVSASSPCIPGVTIDRRRGMPIYVSEPEFPNQDGSVGAVAEIDPRPMKCPGDVLSNCARVRHWALPTGTGEPRQIRVDDEGRLWGITSSGNLFSLDIQKNCDEAVLTRHDPVGVDEYLFAIAPDSGLVGFTDTNNNKVSVLVPEQTRVTVTPKVTYVKPLTTRIWGDRLCVVAANHDIAPRVANATGVKYRTPGDGTYIETDISTGMTVTGSPDPSMFPTGMEADHNWRSGGFYYGVAFSNGSNRIGHLDVRLDKHQDMEGRRSDHDYDHDGKYDEDDDDVDDDGTANAMDDDSDNDLVPDILDGDKDGDGIEDQYESRGNREHKRSDSGRMNPGEYREYEMEYDAHSASLLAVFEAQELTAPLSIEIVNDAGQVVLSTPVALGKAVATAVPALPGIYTVRVKNVGLGAVNYKTTLIGTQLPF